VHGIGRRGWQRATALQIEKATESFTALADHRLEALGTGVGIEAIELAIELVLQLRVTALPRARPGPQFFSAHRLAGAIR